MKLKDIKISEYLDKYNDMEAQNGLLINDIVKQKGI